jgi:hypothetical protein
MVFLHGTSIMHKNAAGRTREDRVQQFFDGDASLHDFASYVPVDNAVTKLQRWRQQGAEIVYLSSHRKPEDVEKDKLVLQKHGFPDGPVFFRHGGDQYSDVAEAVLPDILIEDDARCIGGEKEMTYPHIQPGLKVKIKSIVVKEFGGIDHLPDDIVALKDCGATDAGTLGNYKSEAGECSSLCGSGKSQAMAMTGGEQWPIASWITSVSTTTRGMNLC